MLSRFGIASCLRLRRQRRTALRSGGDSFLLLLSSEAVPLELSLPGSIAELARFVLSRDFRSIAPVEAEIILVEGGPAILPAFDSKLAQSAVRQLGELGVTVRVNAQVTDISDQGVRLGDEFISASTVIWAAGVRATSLTESLGVPLDKAGRIKVGPDLTIPGHAGCLCDWRHGDFQLSDGKTTSGSESGGDADGPLQRRET